MKSFLLSLFFGAIGLGLFIWVIKNIGLFNVVKAFSMFPWWGIFVVLIMTVINFWIGVVRWQKILLHQGVKVSAKDLWGTWLAGFTFSYITPIAYIGGEAVRAGFLKNKFDVPIARGFSSIAIDKILEGTIWLIIITAGAALFLLNLGGHGFNRALLAGGIVVLLGGGAIIVVYTLGFGRARVMHKILLLLGLEKSAGGLFLKDVERDVLNFFHFKNRALWQGLYLSFLKNFMLWVRMFFIILLLGKGAHLLSALVVLAFSFIGYSAPVPGGLGTHEAATSFVFSGLSLGAESGIALSLLVRAADVVFVLIGSFFLVRVSIEMFSGKIAQIISRLGKPR